MDAIYWDASAILSLLFRDRHAAMAQNYARDGIAHLASSLTIAELHAAFARARRSHRTEALGDVEKRLARGPWKYLIDSPSRAIIRDLAPKCALKGADLWHLALAKTLNAERSGLRLLSFDAKLVEAARAEGLSAI